MFFISRKRAAKAARASGRISQRVSFFENLETRQILSAAIEPVLNPPAPGGDVGSLGVALQAEAETYTIWDDSVTPAILTDSDPGPVNLGVRFRSSEAGVITGVRFYKGGPSNSGTHVGSLWTASGQLLASATFVNETDSGWQEVSFAQPVPILANTTYVASYFAPDGAYSADPGYFAGAGIGNGPLRALANGEDGGNGLYAYANATVFPGSSFNSNNYWVDVRFAASVAVTAVSPAPGSVGVSQLADVTIRVNAQLDPATVNAGTVQLRDGANALVPAAVSFDPATMTIKIDPAERLKNGVTYSVFVAGGASGVKTTDGETLAGNFTSNFTTSATPAFSIWNDATVPAVAAENDSDSVEVGVKFRSDVAGYVTGVRFYKGVGNEGTHVGNLWTADGQLLASATFSGETASGWQTVTFATPVLIQPGVTYVASYFAPTGHYAVNTAYFASGGASNATLHALQNGVEGGNGVFKYSAASAFPGDSFNSNNYWVDPLFRTITAPVAQDQDVVTDENTPKSGVVAATDAEHDALTYSVVEGPENGTLVLNANGSFVYTPAAGFSGVDYFTFKANDGFVDSNVAVVSVVVVAEPPPAPPDNTAPTAQSQGVNVTEDGKVTVVLAGTDAETAANQLKYKITRLPTRGVLKLNGVAVTLGQTFTGSPSNLTYEPGLVLDGAGNDSFGFTVTDNDAAPLASAEANVSVNIAKAVADGAISLSGGILRVGGTSGIDLITVSKKSNGYLLITRGFSVVSDNQILASSVSEVRIWGRDGFDGLGVLGWTVRTMIHGGAGTDIIAGGTGDDVLIGGLGADILTGLAGNDVLVGGDPLDALLGGDGHDVMIAGDIAKNVTLGDLRGLGTEWAASKTTTAAEAAAIDSLVTDNTIDVLTGGAGSDWFIVNVGDKILDLTSSDKVTYVS